MNIGSNNIFSRYEFVSYTVPYVLMKYNGLVFLVFVIQAEPYIGITPGCAASESGVTSPKLLIVIPYGYLETF